MRAPPRCSPFPPSQPPPDPSPLGAPRVPSPTPAPRPGLSRTSLRSWRPHVFTGLPAPVDVLSRSDFQAKPQLRRQHQPGPSRAPRRCAPRRRRARPPQLSRPPRPGSAQPRPRARRAQPCHPPTQGSGGCLDVGFWRCRASAGELSASLALLEAAAAGVLATASCAPSLPQDCEFVPLTCWAGLCAPALGPDGAPGWDSGLLELMSNWGSAETGSEVSGRAGLGGRGGWRLSRRRPRRPAGRARQRGRGWTPEQAVRLERGKTGWKRGTGGGGERRERS